MHIMYRGAAAAEGAACHLALEHAAEGGAAVRAAGRDRGAPLAQHDAAQARALVRRPLDARHLRAAAGVISSGM